VRDRTPAPLRGGPHDALCVDEVGKKYVHPFARRDCPHEFWVALDLDSYLVGDGDLEERREDNNKARRWKGYHYDRFTLRVSWPASVSRPVPSQPIPQLSFFGFDIESNGVHALTCDPP
jgi:hypothetical protein